MVEDLDKRVQKAQGNTFVIIDNMKKWEKEPLFTRVEESDTKEHLFNTKNIHDQKTKRNAEMKEAGDKVHGLIDECKALYKADETSDTWKSYLNYIDELVIDGLLKAMASSIGYFLDETDTHLSQGVLFEVRLELSEPDVIFVPPLDKNLVNNFYDKLIQYINYIYNGCSLIPRIAKHLDKNYKSNPEGRFDYLDVVSSHKYVYNQSLIEEFFAALN